MRVVELPAQIWPSFPHDMCANCGTRDGVEAVESRLALVRFFGGGGVQYSLGAPTQIGGLGGALGGAAAAAQGRAGSARKPVRIGHCQRCAPSARRLRPGCSGVLVAIFALGVLEGIVLASVGIAVGQPWLMSAALWLGPLLGAFSAGAWRWTRRPQPGQTSFYQPVYVVSLDQKFSGEIKAWRLGFTNDAYAESFLKENPESRQI